MNPDQWQMLIRKILTVGLPLLVAHGVIKSADPQSNEWIGEAAAGIVAIGSYLWSLKHQTAMKITAVDTATTSIIADLKTASEAATATNQKQNETQDKTFPAITVPRVDP
jgi:hypothetical protein